MSVAIRSFSFNFIRSATDIQSIVVQAQWTDGITNDGFRPQQAYLHFPFANVTVNGLAVLGSDPRVVDYFRGEVAHGPGAFVEVAEGYEDFRRAMTLKLFRELNDMIVGQLSDEKRPAQ